MSASHTHTLIPFPALITHDSEARIKEVDPDQPIAGFLFGGIHAGVKSKSPLLDFGLISIPEGASCAAVYTQNQVVAAPVTLSRLHLSKSQTVFGVLVNSGNANACTGLQGERDAQRLTQRCSTLLSTEEKQVSPVEIQIASTGVIGAPLPLSILEAKLSDLVEDCEETGLSRFARAIMTTDNRPKVRALIIDLEGLDGANGASTIRIGGCAKGAGMIHPNMATMLGYLCTDAIIEPQKLQIIWERVCDQSFNAISIDGDTSTNDTGLCLASGACGHRALEGDALAQFEVALTLLAQALALDILRDGEGVEHVAHLTVSGARTRSEARKIAETVALSPLVKTAMNGCDPNWGRIIAAVGRSGVQIQPDQLHLKLGQIDLYVNGTWKGKEAEVQVSEIMKKTEYPIEIQLGLGEASFTVYTTDLSAEYVKINADYRS